VVDVEEELLMDDVARLLRKVANQFLAVNKDQYAMREKMLLSL
jgi:hypothetical protein